MEKVAKMEYLGTTMNVNGKIDTEINNRVQKANQFYYQVNQTIAGKKEINNHNRMRIYKIVISSHYTMAQKGERC